MLDSLVRYFIELGSRLDRGWYALLEIFSFIGEVCSASVKALRRPLKIRWRDVFYYLDSCGREAVPIVSLICLLMGVIIAYQSAIQAEKFGASIFVADAVGFSILRELGPLMVAIICAGRAGASFAAEIGTMKVNEEINAMTTMGFDRSRFLVMPKLIAMLMALPLLTVIGDLCGLLGGLFVGMTKLNLQFTVYYDRTVQVLHWTDLMEGIYKSLVFAVLITLVGCLYGLKSRSDAQGVGRATTSAVVSGIFLIIFSDAILTILFTRWWH